MGDYEILEPQELMIRLLGRIAFPPEKVREIVIGNRKKKIEWARAYNLCDGKHPKQDDIAKEAGVHQGDFSDALRDWENLGIIFYVKNKNGEICPQGIMKLEGKGK